MLDLKIQEASNSDRNLVQEMGRFYVYEISGPMKWDYGPEDAGALFACNDLSSYWGRDCFPYLILSAGELAGFALVDKKGSRQESEFNVGEFFILRKFQAQGVGRRVAFAIFDRFPGRWEVAQLPENLPAIGFWRTVITHYTGGIFTESHRDVPHRQKEMNVIDFRSPGFLPGEALFEPPSSA